MIKWALIDFGGTGVSQDEVIACAAALTKQLQEHLALPPPFGWNAPGIVRAAEGPTDLAKDEWVLALLAHPDQPGALGYHDKSPNGMPFSKIFPLLDAQDGVPWQATASHEAIEGNCDAETNEVIQAYNGDMYAKENGDPNEAGIVLVDGVPLSDWVTPAWYTGVGGKCNWLDTLKPLEIGPGGYAQKLDPVAGWTQVYHASVSPRPYRRQAPGRAAKRRAAFEKFRALR